MALVPKADPVWRRHWSQWHIYRASGFSMGVLKTTAPHWHRASIVAAGRAIVPVGGGDRGGGPGRGCPDGAVRQVGNGLRSWWGEEVLGRYCEDLKAEAEGGKISENPPTGLKSLVEGGNVCISVGDRARRDSPVGPGRAQITKSHADRLRARARRCAPQS